MLLNNTAPGAATASFAAQQSFAGGANSLSVAAADVNGDGRPDLLLTNLNSANVSVRLNTTPPGATTASFAAQQSFATGSQPYSVAATDLNGDGLTDLVTANLVANTVSVLRNTTAPGATTPSFATQQSFAVGAAPYSVDVADINGDGRPDLAATSFNTSTVAVLLNTTVAGAVTTSFAAQQSFATGTNAFFVNAADVNGDGRADLLVANLTSSNVSVLRNTTAPGAATPSFAAQQTYASGSGPYAVAVADVNGDGQPDLLTANSGSNTVSVLLNSQFQASFADSPAIGTIQYPPPPSLAFGSALFSVNENAGMATITVSRTGSLAGAVSVDYASSAGMDLVDFALGTGEVAASSGADYGSVSGTLNFAAGETSQSFTVAITNDGVSEFFENVALTLSNPVGVGATLGAVSTARLVIADEDVAQVFFASANFVTTEGTPTAVLTVFRTGAVDTAATVNYATANGTAVAGSDFVAGSGTLSFGAGVSFQTFSVAVTDDSVSELNERFTASLSGPVGVTLGNPQTMVVIQDNDTTRLRFSSSTHYVINEGMPTAVIRLFREGNLSGTSSVEISTQDGSALAGSDYTANSTTLSFAPGVATLTFSLPVIDDGVAEVTESLRVNLGSVQGAEVSGAASTLLYITDNEPNELRFSSAAYVIGEASPTAALTVYRLGNLAGNSSVDFATSNGSAQAGSDYAASSGTLDFGPWMATQTISVPIVDNLLKEPIELLNVNLSNPTGGSLVSPASALLYIRDND